MPLSERPRPPSHPRPHPVSCVSFRFLLLLVRRYGDLVSWLLVIWDSRHGGLGNKKEEGWKACRFRAPFLSIGHHASPMSCQSSYLFGRLKVYVQCDGCFARDIRYGSTWRLVSRTGQFWALVPSGHPKTPKDPKQSKAQKYSAHLLGWKQRSLI
ncbi:hypothetical protein BDP81DRAFT_420353 [Colletotrichum phormii]|uniref:Uncharacterized protein n=1 Tax=Colletotrichum phormii TaxID=359342 RepID=A0AAJ0A172_9PEZI|nr:uncharacterized protein BDP81DRAFT_420353 [Colletotrichum phormii]KAK1640589.1 hypothetical protein BDP81DRAFT_420353 [Colletotrichum phormii]